MRILVAAAFLFGWAATAMADGASWATFAEGGRTILIRHATAPGTGDPAGFSIGDCSTQRNLSAEGREQARRIGEAFASAGVPVDAVYSSLWCRCIDTAEHAFPELDVVPLPALNSFFGDRSTESEQTGQALAAIRSFAGSGNQVFVTHQVNITALTGIVPRQGEALLVEPDGEGLKIVARIAID